MIGKVKEFNTLSGCGVITTLTGKELPVQSKNVNMSCIVVLNKNDVVEYELGTDDNDKEQAINVSLISKAEYAVKLSKVKFKDFGLSIKNNILNPPKCETHDEYCLMKYTNTEELQNGICRLVCNSGKYPCGVVAVKRDNSVVMGYSDAEEPAGICRFKIFGIKEAPKEQQYLSVGELITKTFRLENYGIILELEDNFYQTIMD